MAVKFRNKCSVLDFGEDYYKIRAFLIELKNPNYLFGRWDWMITHSHLDKTGLPAIGLWEEGGDIVALATYDCGLGSSYFCIKDNYSYLKQEMLLYAKKSFGKNGEYQALIRDSDTSFQEIATGLGFIATDNREHDAVYPIDLEAITYTLPVGFTITSMAENYDYYKYKQVLWRGFNHELNGEGPFDPTKSQLAEEEIEMHRPNVNLDIKIAVVAPNGDFVSYCGMWYEPASEYALVEPVATDPAYRKLGLGRAAVLEGIKRCGLLGAKEAFVGSSQQFYYNIGFRPFGTSTWWREK